MNAELAALFEEDRADARTFRGDEAFLASQARRFRVEQLLAEGAVDSADDYFHACSIFQHGEKLEHWAQAHLLARTATDLGHPKAPYMVAASYDRWLMHQGKPQKYGTNSIGGKEGPRLWDYNPATTDAERAALDVPPLAELLERTRQLGQSTTLTPASLIFTAELENTRFEIFDLATAHQEEIPSFEVPSYLPFESGDPLPGYLLSDLELFRFGKLFGAKNASGQVVCTWHPASWQISSSSGESTQEKWFKKLAGQPQTLAGQPQTLDACPRYWRRVSLAQDTSRCWIVGGIYGQEDLVKIALSLS